MSNGWIKQPRGFMGGGGNFVKDFGSFAVSYQPDTSGSNLGLSFFAGDDESDETALMKDGEYYILNGDFRDKYDELAAAGGFNACFAFYKTQNNVSSWSDDRQASA